MKWIVLNKKGEEQSSVELKDDIYQVESDSGLLHGVVKAYRANRRQGTHATKTRSLISGGGKKPFKQKGTGNARQGSTRTPLMEGGAVSHGPQPRSYRLKTNKKIRKKALKVAIADKLKNKSFYLVDAFDMSKYKTKVVASFLSGLGLEGKKTLIVNPNNSDFLLKSARNIKGVFVSTPDLLNAEEVLNSRALVISKESLSLLEKRLES